MNTQNIKTTDYTNNWSPSETQLKREAPIHPESMIQEQKRRIKRQKNDSGVVLFSKYYIAEQGLEGDWNIRLVKIGEQGANLSLLPEEVQEFILFRETLIEKQQQTNFLQQRMFHVGNELHAVKSVMQKHDREEESQQ